MDLNSNVASEERRLFLRKLPWQVINGIRSIVSAIPNSEIASLRALGPLGPEAASFGTLPCDDNCAASKPQIARLDIARCLAWGAMSCQLCYLACPARDQAIEMRDQKPVIISSFCDGCSMCVSACETVNDLPAIKMVLS